MSQWEQKCIQEELPECTATCPIHVDVKSLLHHAEREEWGAALKVIRKTIPVPGILGRICDAPCEARCKRRGLGGAIDVSGVERACVQMDVPLPRSFVLPKKSSRVAVVGSGLSGLTVVWDLSKKGYQVTLLESGKEVGTSLLNIAPEKLDVEDVQNEIRSLVQSGVEIVLSVDACNDNFLSSTRESFDAVFLSLESLPDTVLQSECGALKGIQIDPNLQATSIDGLFAGGNSSRSQKSPVWQAAEGRWAATSIDRYLQGVSLTAGREKEEPVETKLYTNVAHVMVQEKVTAESPQTGYTPLEASKEASRCLQCECKECVKVCPYLEKFKAYPKRYVREIHNNATVVAGAHKANSLINGCSLCGLCEEICPEGFSMQDLCLSARQEMVESGYMPQSTHEFALQDMEFSKGPKFSLAKHAPGASTSRYIFYPGCQLAASSPRQVRQVYEYLRSSLTGGVGLVLDCCSAPTYWGGRLSDTEKNMLSFAKTYNELGKPTLILACSSCYFMFKKHLPELELISLWEILEKDNSIHWNQGSSSTAFAIHDPCTTRHEGQIQDSVRALIKRTTISSEELPLNKDKTTCCGFGGLMQIAQPDLAKDVIRQRSEESRLDYITYCSMCRDSMASVGKRAIHILDLFFPAKDNTDAASRPCPGWSERRENRARLKSELLLELWGGRTERIEPYEMISVTMAPDVASKLENRRILISDLQQVIHHSLETGNRFLQPDSGYYKASYRPYHATFWVEYSVMETGYTIHNAYVHRMAVILEGNQ